MRRLVCPILFIFLCYSKLQATEAQDLSFRALRLQHTPKTLSDEEVKHLAELSNVNYTEEILDNILIPRVVGTNNHERVFKYIVGELKKHNWHVDVDEFQDRTPNFGSLTFKNVVGTLNPDAERFLVLACHYDSKYFAKEEFVGATDSAVPCAMMLNLIGVMKDHFAKIRNRNDLSLKLLFLDGEEAFLQWNAQDSIYGAKHLAQKYSENRAVAKSTNEVITDLDKIDVFILLDLIGVAEPSFYSYFRDTERWYVRLLYAEECLKDLNQLKGSKRYFLPRSFPSTVEDDHVPFLLRGVPILHLIPHPFPKTWHTPADDRKSLDPTTIEDLNKILRVFVTEYLHLPLLEDEKGENIPEKEL